MLEILILVSIVLIIVLVILCAITFIINNLITLVEYLDKDGRKF